MPNSALAPCKRVISHLALFTALIMALPQIAVAAHGYAQFGDLKYPPAFTRFDYASPDAKKGGSIRLSNPTRSTSFDTFNPYSTGSVAPGISTLMFETLLEASADEPASAYGLLAEDVTVSADQRSVTFRIRREARFSNGDHVLAADVKYSFDTLTNEKADAGTRDFFKDLKAAEVVDPRTIRFSFRVPSAELPLIAGIVPVFSSKWRAGDPSKGGSLVPPITTGPYRIAAHDHGNRIVYVRDPDYWGRNLPVRVGTFNFDRIEYRLFASDQERLMALHKGLIDLTFEHRLDSWRSAYAGKGFQSGQLIKREFPIHGIASTQGFVFNTRNALFRDVRVRKAIALAFDFEALNREHYDGIYRRTTSWFPNSELAANANARKLSASAPRLFDGSYGSALAEARKLLAQAGWHLRDGVLRNNRGEPFSFEFIDTAATTNVPIARFSEDLAKLGIDVRRRDVSFETYRKRLWDFNFDMASVRFSNSDAPGTELRNVFGAAAANTPGSDNFMGVTSGAIDELIEALVQAKSRTSQVEVARTLDRKLLDQWLMVPFGYQSQRWLAFRRELSHPDGIPMNLSAERWPISLWWGTGAARSAGSAL
jgi:microcin C transport system substrate-binding protein